MVIGEDYVVGKAIDALIKWFNKKKENKEIIHEILMSLKIGLNSILLHMDLCREHGYIKYSKLQIYLPIDIENINLIVMQYQSIFDNDFYEELQKFLQYLVKYNEKINSLHIGIGKELDQMEKTIVTSIKTFVDKLNGLIGKVE